MWHAVSPPHSDAAHHDVASQLTENDYHLPVWQYTTMWNRLKRRMECSSSLVGYLPERQFGKPLTRAGKLKSLLRLNIENRISVRYVLSIERRMPIRFKYRHKNREFIRYCICLTTSSKVQQSFPCHVAKCLLSK